MKLLRTIYSFILLSALLTGCNIYDDMSDCNGNVVLLFDYPYNGNKTFLGSTSRVDVGIYGMDGTLVERRQIIQDSLENFQGMKANLPVGEYKAVFWGNAYSNTSINWDDERVFNSQLYNTASRISSDDNLTYSQLDFSVKASADTVWAHFEPAYIQIQIAVIDNSGTLFPNEQSGTTRADEVFPYINVASLPTEIYDFSMKDVDTEEREFYPQWAEQHEVTRAAGNTRAVVWVANTNVHRMDTKNPVVVNLYNNSVEKDVLGSISLTDAIEDPTSENHEIVPKIENTVYITFVVEKKDQDITVVVKPLPWNQITVIPNT